MALLTHSGTAAVDLEVGETYRYDISDVLAASLANDNTFLGITMVGADFSDLQLTWLEDALNQYKVTVNGISGTGTTAVTFSASDAAVLDIGNVLELDSGIGVSEQVQLTALQGTNGVITRGYGGTTPTYNSSPLVMRIVDAPTYPNSDLGKDMTRARVTKTNYINRWEANVNIDSEQIARSQAGYVPGVPDELSYQFSQRMAELKRKMEQGFLYARPNAAGSPTNDYQTMFGLIHMLDGSFNATSAPYNVNGRLTDSTLNTIVKNIYRQGADSNVFAGGPNVIERVGQLYQDRIRIPQDETGRGFFSDYVTPSLANPQRLVLSAYLNDTLGAAGTGVLLALDMNRIRIRPYVGQMFYTITAPSFRDGDAARMLSKWSLEVRNTGTDVGYAHQLAYNLQ